MIPKRVRQVDEDLLDTVRKLPCMACFKSPCGEAHHVTTVGAGGDDAANNVMPLCHQHHMQWHGEGPGKMIEKYRGVKLWLEEANRWDVIGRTKKGKA